ncbi:ATP-binding protein [Streptomyces somaliensis]|uniref:ATP-binding protein n=1 Tax=Streptomyces somaliensis TaxID=78355 RepID=UPI003F7544D7
MIRLSGHRQTLGDLLYDLFAAVHHTPGHRPDRAGLLALVREIGAVVLLDDLEFGGAALDELLDAAPECAFLLAATPGTPAPSPDASVEEMPLTGLDRSTTLELLEHAVDRPLTDEEANWAGDLWFESEGLPLRFVQAGALLQQRDALRAPAPEDGDGAPGAEASTQVRDAPLPSLGEAAAPAALLASRLSEAARETLRFSVALGGEVPHQAHLPALIGDTHADAALGELLRCGLLTPVGPRHRLAPGVTEQLAGHGYGEGAPARAHTAAQHYAWWVGHPSVAPERVAAEADAVLAALHALASSQEAGHASTAVLLARSAAPALAAGLRWGAWERALRSGQVAARLAGEVAEEAYFHHELGVLALCGGNLDRARAELEASIALRGALADKRGTVAGRRALALVADCERGARQSSAPGGLRAGEAPGAGHRGPGAGPRGRAGSGTAPGAPNGPAASPPGGADTGPDPAAGGGHGSTAAPGGRAGDTGFGTGTAAVLGAGPAPGPGASFGHDSVGSIGADFDAAYGAVLSGTGTAAYESPGRERPARKGPGSLLLTGTRRNLVAAGAGAVLAAVLGTVVTLGATSGGGEADPAGDRVVTEHSSDADGTGGDDDGGSGGEAPGAGATTGASGGGTGDSVTGSPDDGPGPPERPGPPGSTDDAPAGPPTGPSAPGGGATSGGTGGGGTSTGSTSGGTTSGGSTTSPGTTGSPGSGGSSTTGPGPSGSTTTSPSPSPPASGSPTESTDPGGGAGGTTGESGSGGGAGGAGRRPAPAAPSRPVGGPRRVGRLTRARPRPRPPGATAPGTRTAPNGDAARGRTRATRYP